MIMNSKDYSSAFSTQDFPKEIADERSKFRKIVKNAKDNNIQVELRKNKIFVVLIQMSYGLKEFLIFKRWNKPLSAMSFVIIAFPI